METKMPDPDILFKDAAYDYEIYTKSKLEEYRNVIIALVVKNVNRKKILEYLNDNGIDICYSSLWRYLQKKPITDKEKEMVKNVMTNGRPA